MTTQNQLLREALQDIEQAHDLSLDLDHYAGRQVLVSLADKIKVALAQTAEGGEVVAWRTFDGEGGYDYRDFEGNENYAAEWERLNPRHKGWVEPLYTNPPASQEQAQQPNTQELPPLPSAVIGLPWRMNDIDGSIVCSAYTERQMRERDAMWQERLNAASAQQPATGEPVAWMLPRDGDDCAVFREPQDYPFAATGWTPLYTNPAPSVPDDVVRDAERYRWLRDEHIGNCPESINLSHGRKPGLDAAIDDAMLAAK